MTVTKRKKVVKAPSLLFFTLIFFLSISALGCGSLEETVHKARGVEDIAYSVERVVDQTGETFEESGNAVTEAANAIEAGKASFGEETACFTPGLNIGPEYEMTFEIPGRPLAVVKENGEKTQAKRIRLQDFQTANAFVDIDDFASLMESDMLVKIYRNGEPVEMIKESVSDRYSKEDLTDKSCQAYFVESKDRQKDLGMHNSR